MFPGAVPFDAAAEAPGNHAEERENGGAVREFDAGGGGVFTFDGFEEIGPEKFSVVAVGFLELGIFVLRCDGFAARIKCPAVAPADVQRTFGSVKVGAERMFFGRAAREFAVFPDAGEFFEFVCGDLVIGRVARLFLVVENGRAADGAAASDRLPDVAAGCGLAAAGAGRPGPGQARCRASPVQRGPDTS